MDRQAPDNWFEDVYAGGDIEGKDIPWATLAPAPLLVSWLDRAHPTEHGESALVIGCGLGDDAVELARRGFTVTAFDVAETAISMARERFGEVAVSWLVTELFGMPTEWLRAFDLVVEHRTIQSLPPDWQARGQEEIAGCVAPAGELIVVADQRRLDLARSLRVDRHRQCRPPTCEQPGHSGRESAPLPDQIA